MDEFRVTRYPLISKTESGRVSKEILGSGSGSGTRWALEVNGKPFQVYGLESTNMNKNQFFFFSRDTFMEGCMCKDM